ncbi:hypothetical protein [Phenylobacterium sp.]|uniref:hypothetical protein n=1 Tax=Phenylobacterium sp. TaxID=1871053 RepID=UPI0025E0BF58|nr:hypothetical protein [Phenylobacterium sp.]MBX3484207.1 hypothetical protein [Phenylobacterium sp.]MCW5758572.1 hypothetical protein [Phenylobacterium sp.]
MATARRYAQPGTEARPGLFADVLAGWTNDDVLQTEAARAALGARHPQALRVLDWPELRALFDRYDPPATRDGRRDRRFGQLSVALATLGLVLAMASPLAVGGEQVVERVAAVLVVAGLAMMAVHRFGAGARARALARRFGAERVRALYFQAVVNNPGLAARAMSDDAALADWRAARARMLEGLPAPEDLPGQVPRLARPVEDDAEAWVAPEWSTPPAPPEPSKDLDLLLSLLRGQRLEGQLAYVERKLGASLGAPGQRASVVRMLSRLLLAAAVVTGVMAAVLVFALDRAPGGADVKLALEVAAGALVAAMAISVVNDDRRLAGDATRYAAYAAALARARTRFDRGDLPEKLAALRDVEITCHHDLRAFIANHWRAR